MAHNEQNFQRVFDKAISLLKLRQHATGELKRKLQIRGFDSEIIEEVITELTSQRLLNDEEFAQIFLDNLIKYKAYGYYVILGKLKQRGVKEDLAKSLVAQSLSIETETKIARKVVEKSAGLDKEKLAQKLSRKGFRSEVIRKLVF
jgi:regulatory protein